MHGSKAPGVLPWAPRRGGAEPSFLLHPTPHRAGWPPSKEFPGGWPLTSIARPSMPTSCSTSA